MTTTYFSLASGNFSQNWENRALISSNDDWSAVPSITGYLGDYTPSTTGGIDPRTLTNVELGAIDVIANLTSASSTTGGVAEIDRPNEVRRATECHCGQRLNRHPCLLQNIPDLDLLANGSCGGSRF